MLVSLIEIVLFVQVALLDKRQDADRPVLKTLSSTAIPRCDFTSGEIVESVMKVMQSQDKLLQFVNALGAPRGRPRRLHRWKQQRNKNANNCNDNEQFHKCKPVGLANSK